MKVAVMQPYLFPYIGYFQLINAVDRFVLLDDVNYINKGWINRNRILVNGNEFMFTVPLKDVSQNKLIKDVYLTDDSKWRNKFLKTFEMSYKRAPYADQILPIIGSVINLKTTRLTEMIGFSFDLILKYLDVATELVKSSTVYEIADFKAEARILAICQKAAATHYINLIGGKELYSADSFAEVGIKLNFLRASLTPYPQGAISFVPGLSIVDVLMHNSPQKVREFLVNYTLE